MKFSISGFFTLVLFQLQGISQTTATINDVDFFWDGNYIVVNYTITGSLPKEHMIIELRFITEENKVIIPQTITGDVGTNLFSNGKKTIRWDIVKDQILLSGNLKAVVNIISTKILYGGPSNALLSVVVPGLGGHFVEKNKIRSIATTVSTLGLLAYGISQKNLSDKYYAEYDEGTQPSEIEDLYNKANNAHHKYYISTRVAVGIWVFDIVWVAIKGMQNKKEYKSYYNAFNKDGIRLIYVNNGLQLKYSISF